MLEIRLTFNIADLSDSEIKERKNKNEKEMEMEKKTTRQDYIKYI